MLFGMLQEGYNLYRAERTAALRLEALNQENAHLYERARGINERLAVATIRARDLAEEAERRADDLNALVESVAEGVVIVDPAGIVVNLNRAGRDVLGIPPEKWVKTIEELRLDLRTPEGRPLAEDEWPIVRILRSETFAQQEVLYRRPDGGERHLLFAGSATRDDAGNILLTISVFRDITPIRDLERQREEFISVVAHDLRGALTAIRGYTDLLARPAFAHALPEQIRKALATIGANSRRMERMISDLLDVSRIEARQLALMRKEVDLLSLVQGAAQRTADIGAGHPVRLEAHGEIPPLEADPDRLEQVLTNLLSNAAKYSYPGTEIVVEVEARPGEALVSVTNQGKGVKPEDRDKLFTRFHRTRQAKEERVPGLGLGLYIAKGLVEAHGGRIWVESQPGKFATFRFTLPVA
ncbi:MAG: PAS domain S-box protein [Chloroflexi bacterium]|nr:PAS domain S-box protein [Chloroflexota bacterium]